jgi:hypothetical protein
MHLFLLEKSNCKSIKLDGVLEEKKHPKKENQINKIK